MKELMIPIGVEGVMVINKDMSGVIELSISNLDHVTIMSPGSNATSALEYSVSQLREMVEGDGKRREKAGCPWPDGWTPFAG